MTIRLAPAVFTALLLACSTSSRPVDSAVAGGSSAAANDDDDMGTSVSNSASSGDADASGPVALPLNETCTGATDPLTVQGLEQDGNTLLVTVTHAGGCSEHTYEACWNGSLMKSMPPQAVIDLRHDAHGDACEAMLTEVLAIDVTSMLGGGTVVARVGDERLRLDAP
ncbi:MAG: hypothetical protein ACE37F_03170 [Nannocystaceae bacterium]|nr:hypothetical protein [bacterium]